MVESESSNRAVPAYSQATTTSWESLNLKETLIENCIESKLLNPSKIQEQSIPIITNGKSLIAQSPNGSGKTAAFALSSLQMIDERQHTLQCLVLANTKELCMQTTIVYENLAAKTSIRVHYAKDPRNLTPAHLLVATPGTMDKLVKTKTIQTQNVKMLVIDEADEIFNIEIQSELTTKLIKSLSSELQLVLFSATWSESMWKFVASNMNNPVQIKVRNEDLKLDGVQQYYIHIEKGHKIDFISHLYSIMQITQTIIFLNTIDFAETLVKVLTERGHKVDITTGRKTTEDRERIFHDFKQKKINVLVTTNLLSRGLDQATVNLVINFDIPESYSQRGEADFETYLHRVGRTGRFGRQGLALNLCSRPQDFHMIRDIASFYTIDIRQIDYSEIEEKLNKVVSENDNILSENY